MSIKYLFKSYTKTSRLKMIKNFNKKIFLIQIGSVIFKVIPCPLEYIEIRKRFRTQESPVDLIQMPGIQDRTIPNKLPMFIEVMKGNIDDLLVIVIENSFRWFSSSNPSCI